MLKSKFVTGCSLAVGVACAVFLSACIGIPFEPGGRLTIDNKYDFSVTVYVIYMDPDYTGPPENYGNIQGHTAARTTSGFVFTSRSTTYRIEIKDRENRVLFSKDMNFNEFERMNGRITIGP